jgi:4-aminobutyrate aminotransferase-like enzyme
MAPSPILVLNDGNYIDAVGQDSTTKEIDVKPSESLVLHRSLHTDPLHVVGAKGHYLHLSNGQQIFDASGGAAVACLGHGDDRYGSLHTLDPAVD